MTAAKDDRRYIRVYHEAVDDPKFADVWDNDARIALWVRLLVAADLAWPQSAMIPRSAKKPALDALVACGLVDLVSRDQFRIHGMDTERKGRSEHAALAAQGRWHPPGNAPSIAAGNAQGMPNRTEHNKGELVVTGVPARDPRNGHAKPNSVDRNPLLREYREAIKTTYPDDKS